MTSTFPGYRFGRGGGAWRREIKRLNDVASQALPSLPSIEAEAIAASLGKPVQVARELVRRHHELKIEAHFGVLRAAFASGADSASEALRDAKREQETLGRELEETDRELTTVKGGEAWTGLEFSKASILFVVMVTLVFAAYLQLKSVLGSNPNFSEAASKTISALPFAAPFVIKALIDSREKKSTKRLLITVLQVVALAAICLWILAVNATFGATFTAPVTTGLDDVAAMLSGDAAPAAPAEAPPSSRTFVVCSILAEVAVSSVLFLALQQIAERHENLISRRNPQHRRLTLATDLAFERASLSGAVLADLEARVKEIDDLSKAFVDSALQQLDLARDLRGAQLNLLSGAEEPDPIQPSDADPVTPTTPPNSSNEEASANPGGLDRIERNGHPSDDDLRDRLAEHDDRDDLS